MRFLIPSVLLGLAFPFALGGCQTPKSFATPDASWKSHVGQLKYTDRHRTLIGEVVVQQRGDKEFQLDFQKAAELPLISIRADAANTRVEGLLARHSWQGPASASPPPRLRSWVSLREAFARPGSTAGYWKKADVHEQDGHIATLFLASPENDQRFVFQFGR
jgi:hypothetical protein